MCIERQNYGAAMLPAQATRPVYSDTLPLFMPDTASITCSGTLNSSAISAQIHILRTLTHLYPEDRLDPPPFLAPH